MCSTTAFICWSSLVTLSFCPRVCTLHCTAVLSICNITTMVISAAQQLDSWSIVGELRKAYIWIFAIWSHQVSICISSNASYGVNKYIVIRHICNNLWNNAMWQMIIVGNISFSPCCSFFVRFMSHMSWMRKEKDKSGGIFKRVVGTMIQYIDFISTNLDIWGRKWNTWSVLFYFFDGEVFRDLWMVPFIGKFSCETFWGDVIICYLLMCKEQLGPRANWFDNECI